MKNTSLLFYLPILFFTAVMYGASGWNGWKFWQEWENYINAFLLLAAVGITIYIERSKLGERKKEYNFINYIIVAIMTIILFFF